MVVHNGMVQHVINFLNVKQHDPFPMQKSFIKIYCGVRIPKTNKISTYTNQHLLKTFFTAARWYEIIVSHLKMLLKTTFAKAVLLTEILDFWNSVILNFKSRKVF